MSLSSDDTVAFLNGHWVSIVSSNISAAVYDQEAEVLRLRNSDGSVYQYLGVTFSMAESFAAASSAGSWRWDYLRVRGTKTGSQVPYFRE